MSESDSDNAAAELQLGELYLRENNTKAAVIAYSRAAAHLRHSGRTQEYMQVLARICQLEPENIGFAQELGRYYLRQGHPKHALAWLQLAFRANGRDIETLNLLAEGFLALGQTWKVVSIMKELASVYQEQGRAEEANGAWDAVARLAPSDPDLLAHRARARRS